VIALVTGASDGIGLELARLFAADGHDLVLVSRGAERLGVVARDLEERFKVEVRAIPRDLSNPIAPASLFDECGEIVSCLDRSVASAVHDGASNGPGAGLLAVAEEQVG